ncbi:hypothetical protein LIA77_02240 [Sarocladium implicatum]|nr:hypothetical protein LIA77_02240 [Sarocladium implicatum]
MAWTPDALGTLVHATAWSLLVISTSFLAMRIWTRATSRGVGLHMDDYILLAGWFVCVLATGCVHSLMIEFLVPGSLRKINLARAHLCLQSVALGLTKTSFAVTLLRLLPRGWEHVVIWTLIFSMNAQFIAHMFATWQPVCGVEDEDHFPVRCWTLESTVDFAVFSASYSAVCDFVLAALPWKMIFNLQMERSERVAVAISLSMGILAGVTGVLKAYQADLLDDFSKPQNILYNQAMNWVWAQAEPNVTVVSASIPVLRGFTRAVRSNNASEPVAGPYTRTEKSSNAYGGSGRRARTNEADDFDGSDASILELSTSRE